LGALLSFDAPAIAAQLPKLSDDRAPLAGLQTELDKIIDGWPGDANESKVYLGDMGRLVDDISYSLKVGDAWTDPARVRMIPLPAVELVPKIVPPKYARNEKADALTSQRQISVLEGSEVQLALNSVNEKPLKEAYLIAKTRDGVKKLPFTKTDDAGLKWSLPAADSPFKNITEEIRYEIQVTDVDDLHLDTPIRGVIRLRPDRAPSGSAEVVHRVVLPTANPVIGYRLNDDYGISQVLLKVEIERSNESAGTPPPGFDPAFDVAPAAQNEQDKIVSFTLHSKEQPFLPTTEPIRGAYELHLSPLMLVKGDRLKLTLDITDYRGAAVGQTYLSDPLILEISDESGVLAAISEADERSEQRLTDIIKKQLGIGESP
ncbi:MAG TPA: hypothetical protein VL096_18855, partial [Pirellulaceae bacterium]|nr:hypothetical protein [Pirellulaceae bacterium]